MDGGSAFWGNSSIHRTSDTDFTGQQQLYDTMNLSPEVFHQSFLAHPTAENALLTTSHDLHSSLNRRLMQALFNFIEFTRDTSILIQVWVPVSDGDRIALITVRQPHLYDPDSTHLGSYRVWSESYTLSVDEGSIDGQGLPGRVYLRKEAEWSPDVRLFRKDECPRLSHALELNIQGSIALPVFANESGQDCLGVVEIVTTTPKLTCRPEVETICLALQAVNLRSSEIFTTNIEEGRNEIETAELSRLTEISAIINTICNEYGLPLGQTWALDHNSLCATTLGMACYVRDQQVSGFHTACTEQQLRRGQGVVGKAFATNRPCYSDDITKDSKAEYPLSHHAKLIGLRGAVAVQLQCLHPTPRAYAVEFFLPVEFQGPEIMFLSRIMESLSVMLRGSHRFLDEFPISSDGASTSRGNIGVGVASSSQHRRHNETTLMISFGGPKREDSIRLRARGKRDVGNTNDCDAHKTIGGLEQMASSDGGAPDPDLVAQLLQSPDVSLMMELLSSSSQHMAQVWNMSPQFRQAVKHPELLRLLSTDEILQQIRRLNKILSSRVIK